MIKRESDNLIETEPLTDASNANALITSGTVNIAIVAMDRSTVLVADGAAAHVAGGVWARTIDRSLIDTIPAATKRAFTRVKVGTVSDPDATKYREEAVGYDDA